MNEQEALEKAIGENYGTGLLGGSDGEKARNFASGWKRCSRYKDKEIERVRTLMRENGKASRKEIARLREVLKHLKKSAECEQSSTLEWERDFIIEFITKALADTEGPKAETCVWNTVEKDGVLGKYLVIQCSCGVERDYAFRNARYCSNCGKPVEVQE